MHPGLQNLTWTYNEKDIKIVRLDVFKKWELLKELGVEHSKLPQILLWKKVKKNPWGRWFKYDGYKVGDELLHWMNKALSPIITINEAAKVKEFADILKEYEDRTNLFKSNYAWLGAKYAMSEWKTRALAIV